MLVRVLALAAAIALVPIHAAAQLSANVELRWVQTFSTPGDDWVNDIIQLDQRHALALGFLNRVDADPPSDWGGFTSKLDLETGAVARQSEYGAGGGIDAFWTGAPTPDGFIFGGFSNRNSAGGLDAWVLRAAPDGAQLSETMIGEAFYDRITDLAPAGDGGWIGAGHSVANNARRIMIVKVNASGREVWRRIFTEGESSGALYVEPAGDGGFIISDGASTGEDGDLLVMKIDAEGRELWRRLIGAPVTSDVNHGLAMRADGRIVAVGYTQSWGAIDRDMFAVTLSPEGEVLSRDVFGGSGDDRPIFVRSDKDGRMWLVGYTTSASDGDWDVIVAALSDAGQFEAGVAILSGVGDDNGAAIQPLPDGDLLIGGYSASFGAAAQDAFVARIARPNLTNADPRFTNRSAN